MSEKMEVKKNLVPPDGGWGWVVCLAYALNNVIVLPLISNFGLIFQETFRNLNISATQGSVIIIVNHAFGMVLSLFNGPLLRRFGYRKVAIVGSVFVTVGILLTALGESFLHILISYSLMTSIGIAMSMSSFYLAINSYFKVNRGKAMAIGMSITGLGSIFMPQVINFLMSTLDVRGAIFVLGALSLHSLVGACLLRPVKWYMRAPPVSEEGQGPEGGATNNKDNADEEERTSRNIELQDMSKSMSHLSEDDDDYLESGKNTKISMSSLDHINGLLPNGNVEKAKSNPNISSGEISERKPKRWWESSVTEVNLGSCMNIFENNIRKLSADLQGSKKSLNNLIKGVSTSPDGNPLLEKEERKEDEDDKKKEKPSLAMRIVHFFDLTLLTDPIFVNIMIGISLAACAEINFSLLTPFILSDYSLSTSEIAAVMSVIASCDIVFRFLSPFIGDFCKKTPRVMYAFSLVLLILTRFSLFLASSYSSILAVGVGLGIAKGIRSVYVSLVIPNYVPIERLAFASGLQMVTNGFILMSIGPLLGLIRDRSGSYNVSIVCINIVTCLTILLWGGEYLYFKMRPRTSKDSSPS